MRLMDNINIQEMEDYLQKIFDLQKELIDKNFKISVLEFELSLERHMMSAFKKYYLRRNPSFVD